MKIAQIAPLEESCPPRLYGGTERIVSYLAEEQVRQGHEVTLFASGDSKTSAHLVPCSKEALRLDPMVTNSLPWHVAMLEEVRRRADEFDVLHFHIDFLHYPMAQPFADRMVTTMHGRLDGHDLRPVYATFPNYPLVSISDDQRGPLPFVNWAGTVYHGIPRDLLPFTEQPRGDYLAFLGRISPEKRPDRAIEIARRAGMPLKIAAKISDTDRRYWEETIAPMIETCDHVEYVGEINESQKADFLGNARALLFPIDWPEPFGLVMIEAMACGTPVIAWENGSVPEIVEPGLTGYLVKSLDEAVMALGKLDRISRRIVRATFEERFTADRMAQDYIDIYRALPGVRAATTPMLHLRDGRDADVLQAAQ
ncbi:glycosyltransferase family 4 protein [Paracoccus seriniphilus]|uniref:Glycosyltransferase involved in cell wall bisynthesis n=1 Tax=Paracoccus seriniphilus TaxID=184748 RepID=A0A239PQX4_9RHOB|nr:glycosyltransferase family 4 protein [Paracoccus seriniphilus]WCR13022.1 glycosyltransferase family 4 protein [Paracoccus seriniphilus]SNT72538.1 Glycosyltransferase involved in cell wall bisynthesis [Paracoccus seriniphilus]